MSTMSSNAESDTKSRPQDDNMYITKHRTSWSSWLHGRAMPRENSVVFRMADVIREGYLLKQGYRLKMWTKRYFILRLDEVHMTLSYFTSKEDLTLCQETPIGPGYKLYDRAEKKHPFRFELRWGTKTTLFEALNDEDYQGWKTALQEAILWNQAMVPQGEKVVRYGEKADEEAQAAKVAAAKAAVEEAAAAAAAELAASEEKRKAAEAEKAVQAAAQAQAAGSSDKSKGKKEDKNRTKYLPATRPNHHCFMTSNAKFEIPTRYKYVKTLGSGAYGVVISATDMEAVDSPDAQKAVAIKNIQRAFDDLTDAKRIVREIKLMRHLNHKNVLGVLDILEPASLDEFEDVYIVSELMATDLHRVIYSRHALSDEHIAYFMYQMLCALKYMHSAGVIHRDLKPSNILLNGNCELKICDFGLARGVTPGENAELTEYVVTRWYRAPEIMLGCMKYTTGVDVWSLGCMFAEMIGRKPLFPGQDYIDQLHLIMNVLGAPNDEELTFLTNARARKFMNAEWHKRRGQAVKSLRELYRDANPSGIDLMQKMLVIDPAKRISVNEALNHPYLASVRCLEDETTCPELWDFEFEQAELNKYALQCLIYAEMVYFHPEALENTLERLPPESKKAALISINARKDRDHLLNLRTASTGTVSNGDSVVDPMTSETHSATVTPSSAAQSLPSPEPQPVEASNAFPNGLTSIT